MASNEFVAVNWSPSQLLDEDSFDQMSNNINYLRDQAVDGLYQHRLGGTTDTNLKILCGTGGIAARKSAHANLTISFAKMFSPNSYPSVVATPVSVRPRYVFLTVMGIGRSLPNHQGFVARVTVDNVGKSAGVINASIYVNWIAMGY